MIVHCMLKKIGKNTDYVIAYTKDWNATAIGVKQTSRLPYPNTAINIIQTITADPSLNCSHVLFVIEGSSHALDNDIAKILKDKDMHLGDVIIGIINETDYVIDDFTHELYNTLTEVIQHGQVKDTYN